MLNYFKATDGDVSSKTLATALFFFDDADPEAMRLAHREARCALSAAGRVSVFRRAPTVPGYVRAVGEVFVPVDIGAPMEVASREADDQKAKRPPPVSFGRDRGAGAEEHGDANRATTSGASLGARASPGPAGDALARHETMERPGAAPAEGTAP